VFRISIPVLHPPGDGPGMTGRSLDLAEQESVATYGV
jgi:hypothetical protein